MARVALVVRLERRRRRVVAASPDVRLFDAELRGRFGFVEALQRAVVSFIQTPAAPHRDPHLIELVERQPQRSNGAFENGRVRDIELEPFVAQRASGRARFLDTLLTEIDVGPTREAVVSIPCALTVTQQHELLQDGSPSGARAPHPSESVPAREVAARRSRVP